MNLIQDKWIKTVHFDQSVSFISPCQIVQNNSSENPVVDVATSRPDFKGALFQFLIGLLQTVAPQNESEWHDLWETPPSVDELRNRLSIMVPAFDFSDDSPSFMQDYDLKDGEKKPISSLLIESPGGKTLKDNLDHFIKRGTVTAICNHCAALALFTLQINAPSGGVGHRTGLRGGGPLTTLIMPDEGMANSQKPHNTLWHKLWLNVLPEKICYRRLNEYNWENKDKAAIFPWMEPTRTSEKKDGKDTFPQDVHPYQMYWAMPRRIQIDFKNVTIGTCDLCGSQDETLIHSFLTKNYGTNYNGPWQHPLTPHSRRQQTEIPLPLHGQKGGVSYRNWLGLTLGVGESQMPAMTISHYLDRRIHRISSNHHASRHARIWAYGYDMDNMKARCWYDSLMPLYYISPNLQNTIKDLVANFIEAAEEVCANLRQEVKKAWFKRPKDVKGDWTFIDLAFWQATEDKFYYLIKGAIASTENDISHNDLAKQWHTFLRQTALDQFDRLALSGPAEDLELKRVAQARHNLSLWLNTGKMVKKLLSN